MYKHHVKACLALILAGLVFSGLVASFDPFDTDEKFGTWLVLAGFGTAGTFWGLIKTVTGSFKDDKSFFVSLGSTSGGQLLLGGIMLAYATSAVRDEYDPLVWSAFAFGLLTFIVSSLVSYLVEPDMTAANEELQKTA